MMIGTQNYYSLLDKLLAACSNFPPSTEESPMLYNFNKLMNILQKKEIAGIVSDPAIIAGAHQLSVKFGYITRSILTGEDPDPMRTYDALQAEIEQSLSGPMYIYAKQWGLSVKALYYYKQHNFEKALDYSLECVILNEYLIREGIFTLLFRAAEQNKNISRIFFRSGNWQAGATFAKDLLHYLLNGEPGQLYGTIFREKTFWNEIPYVREGYAYQCFRVMVSLMIHVEKRHPVIAPHLFPGIFGDLRFEINTPDRQILAHWMHIRKAFHTGDYEEFLIELLEFMHDPKCKIYDILKTDLLLETIKLVKKETQYPGAAALLQNIGNYLENELHAQEYLNKDLSAANLVSIDDSPEK
ncbi:hypothetical protein [Chitinophaga solisilvae]|uniref:hypothetical protein n=1 Tax=Chitinophaga solisilvae TaxID=1233460 RepID=UPI001368FE0E|nr:hypothetical protein [Chitinophaga solisilvae]